MKGILNAIYIATKNAKTLPEQKNMALKILKKLVLQKKNSNFINIFLQSHLWKHFTSQYREYLKNNR